MTDRELLELAAKAVGRDVDEPAYTPGKTQPFYPPGIGRQWNPLADDGDALRLAAMLRINIEHMKTLSGKDFGINCWPNGRGDCGASEDGDLSDYTACLRRAIVRAAAELGEAMP